MLGKRLINTGGVGACTTDTTQILNAGSTQSLALYRFEDNANDTASGTGKFGKGAVFNGSNSEITLPAALSDGSTTDTNCISFWFNVGAEVTSSSSGNEIMSFSKSGSNTGKIALGSTTGNFSNETFSVTSDVANQYTYITETIPAGWNHAVVQWNSSTTRWDIYINGQAKSTSTFGTNEQGKLLLKFGNRSSYYFDGKLDQVRVFNRSLSSSEVSTLYNETSSTVNTLQILGDTSCIATYTFEGNAQDLSGNYYHGSASNITYDYNGTASNVTYTTGKFGKGAAFNGSNSQISTSSFASLSQVSISMWVNMPDISQQAGLIARYGTNREFAIYMYSGTLTASIYYNGNNGNATQVTASTYMSNDTWHHIAYTANGSTAPKLYIDNVEVGSPQYTDSTRCAYYTSSEPLDIGHFAGISAYNYEGKIDQVRLFDKELSVGEINSLYNETATSAALGTIDNPSLLAYYKMADATDETGNYDGTPTSVDFNVEGKYGFAGKFTGSSKIVIPSDLGLRDSNLPFTFSLWINFDDMPGNGNFRAITGSASGNTSRGPFVVNMYGTSSGAVTASLERYYSGLMYYNSNYNSSAALFTYTPGVWYHLCFVYTPISDGTSTASVYINGSQSGITNPTYTLDTGQNRASANNLVIGVYSSSGYGWRGKLDQIRIFNRGISASEVTTIYNEIQCANTISTPESYFNTKLWTGDGNARSITGIGFDPDFVWIKKRGNDTKSHRVFDSVRGANNVIYADLNNDQDTPTNELTAFVSGGFSLGNASAVNDAASDTYVSWNWKAGGTAVANNDGTIASQVSASPESGFSIVKYTGSGTAGSTVGHGLSAKPELIIIKNLDGDIGWIAYDTVNNVIGYLHLEDSLLDSRRSWAVNNTDPTSTLVTLGNNQATNNTGNFIMYCFHSVDGYQRIGSYIGNGSTVGPFVYTGFEPAWIIIKQINADNHWVIKDNKRSTSNPREERLKANVNNIEDTGADVDFFTNGFQIKSSSNEVNDNNDTYLFYAIAGNPDTTAPTKANSFGIKLYTGDDSNNRDITGLGFKPDFLWIKRRGSEPHALYDSVRGPNLQLTTHNTDTEATNSGSYLGMSSFDADGFNVGNNGGTNRAPHDYVAWAWKGLDHDRNLPAINNDGSITSLVSANIEAGFSIVSYRGNASSGATVGHGLGGELDFLIVKSTNLTQAWNVYVKGVTDTNAKYLRLNEPNNIYTTVNPRFIPGNFNDNVFSIGSDNACNGNNDDYIAYCFRSISGYSKVGTYSGAGSSGKTISTGFQPRFILIKRIDDSSNNTSWAIYDSERGGTKPIRPNTSGDETSASTTEISFTSTGISIPTSSTSGLINESGDTYIYLAIS